MNQPLASRRTRRSFSRSSGAVFSRTPSAVVTSRRARAAHVSGRGRYGCSEEEHLRALVRDSTVASASGFSLTKVCPLASTSAAGKSNLFKKNQILKLTGRFLTDFGTAKHGQGVRVVHPLDVEARLFVLRKEHHEILGFEFHREVGHFQHVRELLLVEDGLF